MPVGGVKETGLIVPAIASLTTNRNAERRPHRLAARLLVSQTAKFL